jgi:hypothetical protein
MAATQGSENERDPHYHTARIAEMLNGIIQHVRDDASKVDDPKAHALFETTAEVLTGLTTAYRHYDERAPAWR